MYWARRVAQGIDHWRDRPDVWAPSLLVVIGILFFSDVLFSSKNFYFRDILNFHYPLRKVLIETYARGEFPLWNPFVHLGQPMLANPNYMAFYPTNLLHLFLPFDYAFKLHFIIHPILGGLGLYFLQRRLGIGALAAFGGSLVYQFSGPVLSFLNLYSIVQTVALMPWVGWGMTVALRGRLAHSLIFGMILSLQVISCEPQLFLSVFWLASGLALLHLLESDDRRKAVYDIVRVGSVGTLFAFGLAAIQVLPTLEMIPLSVRGGGYSYEASSIWSMHPADLVNVVIPNLFGTPYTLNNASYWGDAYHHAGEPYLVSYFAGASTILICLFSFLSTRRAIQRIFLGLTFISVFFALGKFNPLYHWLYDHFRLFQLGRFPSKYFLLTSLSLCVLCSLGAQEILQSEGGLGRKRKAIALLVLLGLLASIIALGIWLRFQSNPDSLETWIRTRVDPSIARVKDFHGITSRVLASVRSSGVFLLAASLVILVRTFVPAIKVAAPVLVLVMGAELIPPNLGLLPLISGSDFSFLSEVHRYLAKEGPKEPYRVVSMHWINPRPGFRIQASNRSAAWLTLFYRRTGQPMYGIIPGLQYSLCRSGDDLNTKESDDLWIRFLRAPTAAGLSILQKINSPVILGFGALQDPRLRQAASFDTETDQPLNVYWLENTLPRAFFASGLEKVASHSGALERFAQPDFPFGSTVILEEVQRDTRPGESGAGVARLMEYKAARVVCEVEAKRPGYLVLLDSYYPGWHAYLDGKEVGILRANYAFRAVEVGSGKHRVEFLCRPRSFYAGLGITSATMLLGAAVVLWGRRRGQLSKSCLESKR